jgi:hypothetical protein
MKEIMLKYNQGQIRLEKLIDENTALKKDNLEKQRKLVEKDAEIENLVKTIEAARGGPPKKSRKSVNFKISPKGAQSSKAMSRSQFNQTKINHNLHSFFYKDPEKSLWMNQSVTTNGVSAGRTRLYKVLPESLRKPKVEKEELRNPAPKGQLISKANFKVFI